MIVPVFDHYLKGFICEDIDTLILACTHYPLLKSKMKVYFNRPIHFVDSALETARLVFSVLGAMNLSSETTAAGPDQIYFTDCPERVQGIASNILQDQNTKIIKADVN
ncbi:MAG: hypothetical protein HQM16_19620 [Deltaproteobacteria bacterium]|nr:hypothetical protein [Deltaproteobacteria bacterium]